MGHKKEKFEGLLDEFKTPAQPPSPLFETVKSFMQIPVLLKSIETYCFEFAHEFLKHQSGNFTRTDLHYDVDGMVALYHCARDGRTYTVKITASK